MNLFLDTSAVIKVYHQEKGTNEFTKYLSELSEDLFFTTSDITKVELHSALLKKHRMKEINQKDLSEVFQLFDKDFQKFNVISVDNFIKNIAIQLLDNLGLKFGLRTLDSLQLASAIFSNNFSKIDYFISSDKKFLNIAKEIFQIINPEEL
ncbi:MAG: type II toxin-antitoxin system VapC family toxin [Ignavibacteriales bacterium]|nr:type II toxin-antitoxin system VapC family toxin [Ignavibacteriales bacterium]MCF8438299.1 type II toxin-antitoxin system VapC family toxin [Ignavibacteriales bacterium]